MTNSLINAPWFRSDKRGLQKILTTPTFQQWENALNFVIEARTSTPFLIGDLINLGKAVFGKNYAQALSEEMGISVDSIDNYASVMNRVEKPQRNMKLGFGHHRAVARFHPKKQKTWLDMSELNGWSEVVLREAIKENDGVDLFLAKSNKVKDGIAWLIENAPNPEIASNFKITISSLLNAERAYINQKQTE